MSQTDHPAKQLDQDLSAKQNPNDPNDDRNQVAQLNLLRDQKAVPLSPKQKRLLELLFNKREGYAPNELRKPLALSENNKGYQSVRAVFSDLMGNVSKFYEDEPQGINQSIKCIVYSDRGAQKNTLYKLGFVSNAPVDHPKAFWEPHVNNCREDRSISLFVSVPTFYRDPEKESVFRFLELNVEGNHRSIAMTELRDRWKEYENRTDIFPSSLYMLRGEIEAREMLADWFAAHEKEIPIKRKDCLTTTRADKDFDEETGVLFGHPRVSHLARWALEQRESDLPYHISPTGIVKIQSEGTVTKLFTDSKQKWKDTGQWNEQGPPGHGTLVDKVPDGEVFAVVTRLRNPRATQGCPFTLISCDYTRALKVVTGTLTRNRQLRSVRNQTEWRKGWPQSFQLLFAVRIGKDGEASGIAELLASCTINESMGR